MLKSHSSSLAEMTECSSTYRSCSFPQCGQDDYFRIGNCGLIIMSTTLSDYFHSLFMILQRCGTVFSSLHIALRPDHLYFFYHKLLLSLIVSCWETGRVLMASGWGRTVWIARFEDIVGHCCRVHSWLLYLAWNWSIPLEQGCLCCSLIL